MYNLGLGLVEDAPVAFRCYFYVGIGVSWRGRATEIASRLSCK